MDRFEKAVRPGVFLLNENKSLKKIIKIICRNLANVIKIN